MDEISWVKISSSSTEKDSKIELVKCTNLPITT